MKLRTARDIMTTAVITADPDMLLTDVIKLLLRWRISGVPVVDATGRLVGVITEHDVMNFAFSGNARDTRVSEAMTKDVTVFPPDTPVEALANWCASKRIRRAPIVEDGRVVGIVSRHDILREMNRVYDRF
ncbi:MAG: CBS domain-containing protein [Verrucomicrobiota bacterium]|nr:CBS domain-containing protein [Verrucomicrobiota bacterium]